MNKPRIGQVYRDKNKFWNNVENMRTKEGLPDWTFDFISVHESWWEKGSYGFCAPMCLVNKNDNHNRMDFEEDLYQGKTKAIKAAKGIAKHYGVFVLVCTDNGHDGTLTPGNRITLA